MNFPPSLYQGLIDDSSRLFPSVRVGGRKRRGQTETDTERDTHLCTHTVLKWRSLLSTFECLGTGEHHSRVPLARGTISPAPVVEAQHILQQVDRQIAPVFRPFVIGYLRGEGLNEGMLNLYRQH